MRDTRLLPAASGAVLSPPSDTMHEMIRTVGLVAGIALPFWNIPLILRIQQRKSSKDISLPWAVGVLACIYLMLPSAMVSPDAVFKVFSLVNTAFFTVVVIQVVRYH